MISKTHTDLETLYFTAPTAFHLELEKWAAGKHILTDENAGELIGRMFDEAEAFDAKANVTFIPSLSMIATQLGGYIALFSLGAVFALSMMFTADEMIANVKDFLARLI